MNNNVPIQSLIDHIKTAMDVDPWAKEMAEELLKEQESKVSIDPNGKNFVASSPTTAEVQSEVYAPPQLAYSAFEISHTARSSSVIRLPRKILCFTIRTL